MEFPEERIPRPKEFIDDLKARVRTLMAQQDLAKIDPDRVLLIDLLAQIQRAPKEYTKEAYSILCSGGATECISWGRGKRYLRKDFFESVQDFAFPVNAERPSHEDIKNDSNEFERYGFQISKVDGQSLD